VSKTRSLGIRAKLILTFVKAVPSLHLITYAGIYK